MKHATGRIERGDCRIFYETLGEGPAIVFAHGLGGSHLSWWQQLAHFARGFTCIAFSHRGFAPSTAPADGPDPMAYADDVAALLDALGHERATIVGQSMGGWSGVEFALRWPERLDALVLSSTSGTIDYKRLSPSLAGPLARWEADSAARRARCEAHGFHVATGARMAAEQPALHLLYTQIDKTSADLDKGRLRGRLMATRRRDPAELGALRAPTLVIAGEEDIVFPACVAVDLAAAFPRGLATVFPQTGHSPYFERPQAFNEAVARFLASMR